MNDSSSPPRFSRGLGTVLVALGAAVLLLIRTIPASGVGNNHDPGPRAFPLLLATALLLLGIWEWAGVRCKRPDAGLGWKAFHRWLLASTSPGSRDAFWFLGGLVLYVLAMPWFGFTLATLLFSLGLIRFLGVGWVGSVVASAVLVVSVYGVFVLMFKVPLPGGWLGY